MRRHSIAAIVIVLCSLVLIWSAGIIAIPWIVASSIHRVIETRAETLATYIGRFHPLAVHFPIAFVFGAALTDLLFGFTHQVSFASGSRLMLWLGLAGMMLAVPLGLAAKAEYGMDSLVHLHQSAALASLLSAIVATATREAVDRRYVSEHWRAVARAILLVTALLVAWTGFLGAEMVHGVGHLSWPH